MVFTFIGSRNMGTTGRSDRKSYKIFVLKDSTFDKYIQSAIIAQGTAEATFVREALLKHAADVLGIPMPNLNVVIRHVR